jgi:hypothetical protein
MSVTSKYVTPRIAAGADGGGPGALISPQSAEKKRVTIGHLLARQFAETHYLLVHRSLFEGMDCLRGCEGWIFRGRTVRPRRAAEEITTASSAGPLLLWLASQGGEVCCPAGTAGATARRVLGVNSSTLSQVTKALLAPGHIERDANARRTFRLALTDTATPLLPSCACNRSTRACRCTRTRRATASRT